MGLGRFKKQHALGMPVQYLKGLVHVNVIDTGIQLSGPSSNGLGHQGRDAFIGQPKLAID